MSPAGVHVTCHNLRFRHTKFNPIYPLAILTFCMQKFENNAQDDARC